MNPLLELVDAWAERGWKRSFEKESNQALLRNMGSGVGGAVLAMVFATISSQCDFDTGRKVEGRSKMTMMSMISLQTVIFPGAYLVV